MTKRMLIDAVHASERRVAIVEDDKLLEFDFETLNNQSTKGNIYLAKVVRVEPSLQAAFLDYGQERHGFLAFSDIQHSNYQIPIVDREALAAEQERILAESDVSEEIDDTFDGDDLAQDVNQDHNPDQNLSARIETDDVLIDSSQDTSEQDNDAESDDDANDEYDIEISGGTADETEEAKPRKKVKSLFDFYRRYKIQEVVKRGQIMLVQVVKDERGNKGAALTTYISLPGRYCVLMPNAFHKGGVSRKISDAKDRRRLRMIVESLELPKNISLIVRTAGKDRNKMEIRRDSEYLMRLWDEVRDKTLSSNAPALIYEEGDLIRQSIRDLYRKEMIEVLVDGEQAHKEAKAYMKQLSPSHAVRVKRHGDPATSLFAKYGVEAALSEMYSHEVTLKSGGYLIINHTEALVAIDINSGRATRERNIVDTAYKTNLEAAEEIARQVRLRNLSGLVVIDFIDMDNNKHIGAVERKFRESMRDDRARVQIGHISQFGLMEFSRQRMGASYLETITQACSHCHGRGVVPAKNLLGVRTLRKIQELASNVRGDGPVSLRIPADAALYVLNSMRDALAALEESISRPIIIIPDATLAAEDAMVDGEVQTRRRPPAKTQPRSSSQARPPRTNASRGANPQGNEARKNHAKGDVDQKIVPASQVASNDTVASGDESATSDLSPGGEGNRDRSRSRRRNRNRRTPITDGVAPSVGDAESGAVATSSAEGAPETSGIPGGAPATGSDAVIAERTDGQPARRKRSRRRRPRSNNIIPPLDSTSGEIPPGQPATPSVDKPSVKVPVNATGSDSPEGKQRAVKPQDPAHTGVSAKPSGDAKVTKRKGWWSRLVETDDSTPPKDDK